MAAPRYEERVTRGGITVRQGGAVIHEPRSAARPEPVLQPVPGEARASTRPHAAMTGTHIHEHHDYGQGTPAPPGQRLGIHIHEHTHNGDGNHSPGSSHPHRVSGTPPNPDAQMNSADPDPGDEMRDDVSGFSLIEQMTAYLEGQGVDVGRALADAGYEREHKAERARGRAARAEDLARSLRRAKRALQFEQDGYLEHAPGFGIARVGEAQTRVDQLTAALAEACVNDAELISEARARAAR